MGKEVQEFLDAIGALAEVLSALKRALQEQGCFTEEEQKEIVLKYMDTVFRA